MSPECQNLMSQDDAHSKFPGCEKLAGTNDVRFWPNYDSSSAVPGPIRGHQTSVLTSFGYPVVVRNALRRPDSDQTWTLWADIPWMFWWHHWMIYYAKSHVHRRSPWRRNWCQIRTSMDGKKYLQKEVNRHPILTSVWPKPDVPKPLTGITLLAG